MKITIDDKACLKHKLTPEEVLLTLAIRSSKDLQKVFDNLVNREVLVDREGKYYVTQHWSDEIDEILCDSIGEVSDDRINNLAEKLRDCYPKGKMPNTPYYYRCNSREVRQKLKKFFTLYGKYSDGLRTISFTGTKSTKVAPVDFLLGRPTMRVLVNYFTFDNSGFNPLLFAVMKGEFNMESLMLLSATPQGKKLFNNLNGTGFNPMFLALMNKDKEGDSGDNMLQTMMMMSMMGNGGMQNPLSNIFGGQPTPQPTSIPEPTPVQTPISTDTSELLSLSKKVDSLTDTVCKLSRLVMSDIGVLKNQKAQLKDQPKEQPNYGVQPDCNH